MVGNWGMIFWILRFGFSGAYAPPCSRGNQTSGTVPVRRGWVNVCLLGVLGAPEWAWGPMRRPVSPPGVVCVLKSLGVR